MFHAVYLNVGKIKQFKPINFHDCVYKYLRSGAGVWEDSSQLALLLLGSLVPGSVALSLETQIY